MDNQTIRKLLKELFDFDVSVELNELESALLFYVLEKEFHFTFYLNKKEINEIKEIGFHFINKNKKIEIFLNKGNFVVYRLNAEIINNKIISKTYFSKDLYKIIKYSRVLSNGLNFINKVVDFEEYLEIKDLSLISNYVVIEDKKYDIFNASNLCKGVLIESTNYDDEFNIIYKSFFWSLSNKVIFNLGYNNKYFKRNSFISRNYIDISDNLVDYLNLNNLNLKSLTDKDLELIRLISY